jgi:RNA polymerase sigma factor (sigma-70 family)
MVHRVCRHVLHDPHDAEDAFQATFLVLVRKAAALQRRALLSNWLYRVAYRIAVRARANRSRRHRRETQGREIPEEAVFDVEPDRDDLRSVLHEEINRLPAKYHAPIVLCYLQGKTNEEAARQLEWPIRTVKGRLTRARELLRLRLTRRGLACASAPLAILLSHELEAAALSAGLINSTVRAALVISARQTVATGVVSAQTAALLKGTLRSMYLTKLTIACTTVLGIGTAGMSTVLLANHFQWGASLQANRGDRSQRMAKANGNANQEKPSVPDEEDLKQAHRNVQLLSRALWGYHDAYGNFPPAAVIGKDGNPLLSWRVLILPYLKKGKLFKEFKLDEPWDSPHNKALLPRMPKVFAPVRGKEKDAPSTFYQVFTGKRTIFEGARGCRLEELVDGASVTVLFIEAAQAVPWTKPADLPYDSDKPLPKIGGLFKEKFLFATADGAAHFGKKEFDQQQMRFAISRDDGLNPGLDKITADE